MPAPFEGLHVPGAELRELEHRTGARGFVRSSAVGDDRPRFGLEPVEPLVFRAERDVDGSRNVAAGKRSFVAHVDDEDLARGIELLKLGERDARRFLRSDRHDGRKQDEQDDTKTSHGDPLNFLFMIIDDPAVVSAFLEDAAHVPGGYAEGVAFPRDAAEVAALVRATARILPVGAQSSLTGGATPRGEIVLSTRALTGIELIDRAHVRVGAGVPLADLQRTLLSKHLYYPPVPTFDGAFIGGTIATNAAGAATFKYGSTRQWIHALAVVLASGDIVDFERGRGDTLGVPWPSYAMPRVPKHSAGYYSTPGMEPIDLFIGSEGTLGVIVAATVRVIERPEVSVALVPCTSDAQALAVTSALRDGAGGDVSGVEYIDSNALACLDDDAFARAGIARPRGASVLLLAQIEGAIDPFAALTEQHGLGDEVIVAAPDDHRGAARLFELREAVPAAVNRRVAEAKARAHPDIEKTAADMIVPFERLGDSLDVYRRAFARRGLEHAIWGHFSDGNLHPNVIPRSLADVVSGKDALLEIGRAVIEMGGSPLAEHGVGRNPVKQALMHMLYGTEGIEQMRAIKRALDPESKFAPGVLFPQR